MENEDVIREKMEDTRTSMTEKIEKLEQKVTQTVTGTTEAVAETVEAVKETVKGTTDAVAETVEKVKETVQDTIQGVTSSVQGGIRSVKDFFTPRKHPWVCMGTSVVAGFVVSKLLFPARRRPEVQAMAAATHPIGEAAQTPVRTTSQVHTHNGGHRERSRKSSQASSQSKGILQGLSDQITPELDKLKNMAIGMLVDFSRDFLIQAVPQQWRGQFLGIFQGVADKLTGGQPTPGSEKAQETMHQQGSERGHQPEMERSGRGSQGTFGR